MTTATVSDIYSENQTRAASKAQNKSAYIRQVAITVWSLAAFDYCCLLAVSTFAVAVGATFDFSAQPSTTWVAAFAATVVAAFYVAGVYKPGVHPIYETRQSLVALAIMSLMAVSHLSAAGLSWFAVLLFVVLAGLVPIARSLVRKALAKTSWWGVPCYVYGADRRINSLYAEHKKNATRGLVVAGFLQDKLPKDASKEVAECFLGKPSNTSKQSQKIACAMVHRRGRNDAEVRKFVDAHLRGFSRYIILGDDPSLPSLWSFGGNAGISVEDNVLQPASQVAKRVVDIVVAGTALTFGAPVFAALTLWVKATSPGPVFFGHTRICKDGRRFKAWKFRSMVTDAEEVLKKQLAESAELRAEWDATQKLQNDPRITTAGRFLRKTSLDELPQLWNVLVGDMSLVGPRPIVASEINKYQDTFRSYLRVRPGITGFWQVSGRNLTTYERRVELDEYYVRNWSFWFDLYILVRTVKTVLFREGAF